MRSHVFIASLLHNVELWHSHVGRAGNYANFFGPTCLYDGPDMAALEVWDAFGTMGEYWPWEETICPKRRAC